MKFKSFNLLIIVGLLFASTLQECVHDKLKIKLEEVPDEEADASIRLHQLGADSWGPLRIHADFSFFQGTRAQRAYIEEMLLPAAFDYFKATLKVPQMNRLMTSSNKICEYSTPAIYRTTGVAADLVLLVTGSYSNENFVAFASPCLLLQSNSRPIFGRINFNYRIVTPSMGAEFESDVLTAMHEITHVLGISNSLFDRFPAQHRIGRTMSNGQQVSYIDLPPLTERLRKHFNCPTLKGAYLEDDGGAGSAGSHLERRIFMNDYMTASVMPDQRISEFSLAFLEGSGWYQVNYDMADPLQWGKGEGCAFVDGTCFGTQFPEFCSDFGATGCTFDRTYGAYCGSPSGNVVIDKFADNCPFFAGYSNTNCQDPTQANGRSLSAEAHGQHSRCFAGTIYPGNALTKKRSYCLNYKCKKQDNGKYELTIDLGNAQPICRSKGSISVNGYGGRFDCPDPDDFCSGAGKKFCKRGCMGRGTCSNAKCECAAGYSGATCMTKTLNFFDGVDISQPPFDAQIDVDYDHDDDFDFNRHNSFRDISF